MTAQALACVPVAVDQRISCLTLLKSPTQPLHLRSSLVLYSPTLIIVASVHALIACNHHDALLELVAITIQHTLQPIRVWLAVPYSDLTPFLRLRCHFHRLWKTALCQTTQFHFPPLFRPPSELPRDIRGAQLAEINAVFVLQTHKEETQQLRSYFEQIGNTIEDVHYQAAQESHHLITTSAAANHSNGDVPEELPSRPPSSLERIHRVAWRELVDQWVIGRGSAMSIREEEEQIEMELIRH